ncbi:MAG: hypothetical protein HYV46_07085, partial [candidate division NC10 bacterium]|nr:hypothetical protein [candidate division NC10 bacterium]
LPRGTWTDFWSDRTYQGPSAIEYPAPLEVLPLLVRDDCIIPLGPEMPFVGERPTDPLTLEVYLTSTARCTVEDGDATTRVTAVRRPGVTLITIVGPERTYIITPHRTKTPRRVSVNSRPLPRRADKKAFDHNPQGWWRDPRGRVQVKVRGSGELRVRLLD